MIRFLVIAKDTGGIQVIYSPNDETIKGSFPTNSFAIYNADSDAYLRAYISNPSTFGLTFDTTLGELRYASWNGSIGYTLPAVEAIMKVLVDEINAVRVLPLLGLAAISVNSVVLAASGKMLVAGGAPVRKPTQLD